MRLRTPGYLTIRTTRSGRTTKINTRITQGHEVEKKTTKNAGGGGTFDRFATGPEAHDIVALIQSAPEETTGVRAEPLPLPRAEPDPEKAKSQKEAEENNVGERKVEMLTTTDSLILTKGSTTHTIHSGLRSPTPHSLTRKTADLEADKENIDPFSTPTRSLQERFKRCPGYVEEKNVTVIDRTPGGTALRLQTVTPRERFFVRAFKTELTIQTSAGETITINVQLFQTEKSAQEVKKVSFPSPSKHAAIKAKMTRPVSDTYLIDDEKITADTIKHNKAREYTDKLSGKDISAACKMPARSDRHHLSQHSIAPLRARAVLTEEQKANGIEPDERSTLIAPWTHNSMRLASPIEHPSIRRFIQWKNHLYYTDECSTFMDADGPIPIIETEEASWRDEKGNKLKVIFDPHNKVRPAKNLRPYNSEMLKFTLGSPPREHAKKSKVRPTKRKDFGFPDDPEEAPDREEASKFFTPSKA